MRVQRSERISVDCLGAHIVRGLPRCSHPRTPMPSLPFSSFRRAVRIAMRPKWHKAALATLATAGLVVGGLSVPAFAATGTATAAFTGGTGTVSSGGVLYAKN